MKINKKLFAGGSRWMLVCLCATVLIVTGLSAFGSDESGEKKAGSRKIKNQIPEKKEQSTIDWVGEKLGTSVGYVYLGGLYLKKKANEAIESIKNTKVPFVDDINDKFNERNEAARKRVLNASSRTDRSTREDLFQQMKKDNPKLVGAYGADETGDQFWFDLKNYPKKFDANTGRQLANIDDFCKVADAGGYSHDTTTRQEDQYQVSQDLGEVAVKNVAEAYKAVGDSQDVSGDAQEIVGAIEDGIEKVQTVVEVVTELVSNDTDTHEMKVSLEKDKPEAKTKPVEEAKPEIESKMDEDKEAEKEPENEAYKEVDKKVEEEKTGGEATERRTDKKKTDKKETHGKEEKELPVVEKEAEEKESDEPRIVEKEAKEPNSGGTTTTKGYVENSKGRTTVTETRAPDGSLISTTETRTDSEGKVIGQDTYKGESGEGKTTSPGRDLRNAEPKSNGESENSNSGGEKKAGLSEFTSKRSERTAANAESSFGLMAEHQNVAQSSSRGDQADAEAKNMVNAAGGDAQSMKSKSASSTAAAEKADGFGKAIAEGLLQGVETGFSALGSSFGHAAAKEVSDAAFGDPDKPKHAGGGGGRGGGGEGEGEVEGKDGSKVAGGGKAGGGGKRKGGAPKKEGAPGPSKKTAEAGGKPGGNQPAVVEAPKTRRAAFCKKCGSEMIYNPIFDLYDCPGCNSPYHHVSGECPWEFRQVPIDSTSTSTATKTPTTTTTTTQPPATPSKPPVSNENDGSYVRIDGTKGYRPIKTPTTTTPPESPTRTSVPAPSK